MEVITLKLHHIGIAVKNIQESLGELTKFLNFESTTIPTLVGSQKVSVCFLKTNNVYIELIEPAEENSPISTFTANGGGFHHICFEVNNIHKEVDKMVKNGARIVVEPVIGFDDRLIAFLLLNMENTNCNLIELVEIKK
jgi:methylmalonyl-CoA/ethylmalonyl-CoA epimerase